MLTGESIPVIKSPLPFDNNEIYHQSSGKIFTLFSGTEVIQNKKIAGNETTAVVIRTGFDTLKGSMVKSILYPRPTRFHFFTDALIFTSVFGGLALIGFFIALKVMLEYFEDKDIVLRLCNIITIAVPPALPAAMSVGIVFALARLRRGKIYSISPETINAAGRVKTTVFDKTGTLTEDTLRFSCVVASMNGVFSKKANDVNELLSQNEDTADNQARFTQYKLVE